MTDMLPWWVNLILALCLAAMLGCFLAERSVRKKAEMTVEKLQAELDKMHKLQTLEDERHLERRAALRDLRKMRQLENDRRNGRLERFRND